MHCSLTILLPERNIEVSPWSSILILFYPLMETLFSIVRKIKRKGYSPGKPDGVHLHMIVYKRVFKRFKTKSKIKVYSNALTSMVLWCFPIASLIFSTLFYQSSLLSLLSIFLLGIIYLIVYSKLTLQKTFLRL